jgi:predicted dehydrogenase
LYLKKTSSTPEYAGRKNTFHVALLGYGYWGINILRNLVELPQVSQISVCDINIQRLNTVKKMFPEIFVDTNYRDMLTDPDVDAVCIATPSSSHFELCKFALLQNKHVFVEKPFTSNTQEAAELMELAQSRGLIISVDHTFLYNAAVHKIKEYIDTGQTGKVAYIDCTRVNLGIYQPDVNVLWDLASHDLSIIHFLIEEHPTHIRAIGKFNLEHQRVDMAYLFLYFSSGLLVQVNCSWASPVKIRQIMLGGREKMIIYDDIEPTHKLRVYDYSRQPVDEEQRNKMLVDYRLGDITIPKFSTQEPLKAAIEDFLSCVQTGNTPISDSASARQIVYWLEKAEFSLKNNGELVAL